MAKKADALEISLSPPGDLAALGAEWEVLQARAACSFFQSWSWVGCLAAERYDDPLVLRAAQNGVPVALGLFNRRRASLLLHETGRAAWDSVFIEHNGLLVAPGDPAIDAACLRAAMGAIPRAARMAGAGLTLPGVDERWLQAARCAGHAVALRATRPAPFRDLASLRGAGKPFLDAISPNMRRQLRRSAARYAQAGPLAVVRAATVAEAHGFLDGLAALHQARWTARGLPGAFAEPAFRQFHQALIARALPRGEVDLLRISAGSRLIGYLYNLRSGGHVHAYQGGFDYSDADGQRKPGLTCHHLAIEASLAAGATRYDFLAGDDRYKRDLSDAETTLYWAALGARYSLQHALIAGWRRLRAG